MARDTRRAFNALLDRLEPTVRDAFLAAFDDIRSPARFSALEAAIERGDIEGVLQALNLRDEFFAPLDRQIENAFYQGGVYQLAGLPKKPSSIGGPLVVRFSQRNPRAESWVRRRSSTLITEITADQRTGIQRVLQTGLEAGRNPRGVALDLVGRVARGSNRRTGGLVGLTSGQMGYVDAARAELRDPDLMRAYFKRSLRDQRHDRTVLKALREGRPVSEADIRKITGRYADRLLFYRGETIARTETIQALNAGRDEAIEQLIESGEVPRQAVKHKWSATLDARTRDIHRSMHGQEVIQGQPFTSPTGAQLLFPGDTSLGAGGGDTINCRCYAQVSVDWLSLAR